MMTKKHFETIAATLRNSGANYALVSALADQFAAENPRFDRAKFIEACNVSGPPENDLDGVNQTYDALTEAGYIIDTQDCDTGDVIVGDREKVIAEAYAADSGYFLVREGDTLPHFGWVWFVFGNAPEEVISDHTTNLSHVLDPLSERWGW